MPNANRAADGRVARGARTRQSVIAAFEVLIADHGRAPTAADLARQAGVSCRSIFTHFGDMNGVMSAAAQHLFDSLADAHTPVSHELPIEERIEAFIAQRVRNLEITSPLYRTAMAQSAPSARLSQLLTEATKLARADEFFAFKPEIERLDEKVRAELEQAIHAVTTWHHWEGLRSEQLLSLPQATAVMRLELRGLLDYVALAEPRTPHSQES